MTLNLNAKMANASRLIRAQLTETMGLLQGRAARDAAAPPMRMPPRPDLDGGLFGRFAKLTSSADPFVALRQGTTPHPFAKPAEPPLPQGAQFLTLNYANAAGSRSYKLYIPSCGTSTPLPLIVMLHGCKQSPDDFAAGTRMNAIAEELGLLVAYPSQPASANPSRCWNWFSAGDQSRGSGEPSLIAGITTEIMKDFAVDRARIYVAGLSAGGAAAAIMGSTYPDLYAAIGVHSGLACGAARDLPSAFNAMRTGGAAGPVRAAGSRRPLPTIVFHGDRDVTVHSRNGDEVIAQSRAAGTFQSAATRGQSAGGVGYTRTVSSDAAGRVILEQWLLHGSGHAWSGGSPAGSYTDARGPDASREMIRFFMDHRMRPESAGGAFTAA